MHFTLRFIFTDAKYNNNLCNYFKQKSLFNSSLPKLHQKNILLTPRNIINSVIIQGANNIARDLIFYIIIYHKPSKTPAASSNPPQSFLHWAGRLFRKPGRKGCGCVCRRGA